MEKLGQEYPGEIEPVTLDRLRSARLDSALQSVATNAAINKRKSDLLLRAFLFTMAAFSMNLATLAYPPFLNFSGGGGGGVVGRGVRGCSGTSVLVGHDG